MADSFVQVAPDGAGKQIDAQSLTGGSGTVYRQTTTLGDPTAIGSVQSVKAANTLATASDGAAVVIVRPDSGGSTGLDFSANKPTLPNVGADFPGSGPYASWVLIATVPASAGRRNVEVQNMSASQILLVRDDGTASSGAAPVNASAFTLNARVTTGPEGGGWRSHTFRGRLQIYAAGSGASVMAFTD